VVEALIRLARDEAIDSVSEAMELIEDMPSVVLHRRELWRDMKRAVALCPPGQPATLGEVAWHDRDIGRNGGRRVELRTVSRTALVKGLELDHAIVLNADSLDSRNLYVALTRGTRSLTILSSTVTLQPHA